MILEALKSRTMELRKARHPMAVFLVTVSAKANDLAKAENPLAPVTTEDHALRAINSFIKAAEDNIKLLQDKVGSDLYMQSVRERDLLKEFLPEEASDSEVRAFVLGYISEAQSDNPKKLIGAIMKALDVEFGASLNKRSASAIAQEVING